MRVFRNKLGIKKAWGHGQCGATAGAEKKQKEEQRCSRW